MNVWRGLRRKKELTNMASTKRVVRVVVKDAVARKPQENEEHRWKVTGRRWRFEGRPFGPRGYRGRWAGGVPHVSETWFGND